MLFPTLPLARRFRVPRQARVGVLLALLVPPPVAAQTTTVAVPATAAVITAAATQQANNTPYWVCGNAGLSVRGNGNTVFGEAGATLVINGNNNVVYAQGGAPVTVTGNNNDVYVVGATSTTVQGNNNVAHVGPSVDLTLTGQNSTRSSLDRLTFSYTLAPATGCRPLAMGDVTTAGALFQVMPNPVGPDRELTLLAATPIQQARLYDATGRLVSTWLRPTDHLDLRAVPRGIYQLHVTLSQLGVVKERVVIE